jgi:hypothetical protein
MVHLPAPVTARCRQQQGVIARCQLVDLLGEDASDRLLAGPWFERLERGVFRLAAAPELPIQCAVAAALRARPAATITGPVVLGFHQLDGFQGEQPFEILTSPDRRLRGVDFPHRPDPDPARPVSRLGEVRLARPLDALIDSGAFVGTVGERALRLAYDQLRWRGRLDPHDLSTRIRSLGAAAPGGRILAELLELGTAMESAESDGERGLGRLLMRFDPLPEPQVYVTPRRRVDWFFRALRLAYEYLGTVDHATQAARAADAARDEELRTEGIKVVHVVSADLSDERALLSSIVARLTVRADELGMPVPVLRRVHA